MWSSLKPSAGVISLDSSSEDEMKIAATSPEQQKTSARRVVGKKSPAEIAAAANRDAEVVPSNTPVPDKKNNRGQHFVQEKWGPHTGHGICRGADSPCVMGVRGAPASAGPSGYCDLCNLEDLELLHREGQGRLTHLLLQLAPAELAVALARLEAIDKDIAENCRRRMKRARDRKNPARAKRPARGPYKKRKY